MTTHSDVAHNWAHQTGKARKGFAMFYDDETIYSWGYHFAIARHCEGVVLFTSRDYSVSTSKHKSIVSRAASHLNSYLVPDVMARTKREHRANYEHFRKRVDDCIWMASRRRKGELRAYDLERAQSIAAHGNEYAAHFRIGKRKAIALPDDIDAQLEELKKERDAERARVAKIEAEKRAKWMVEGLPRWRMGENIAVPYMSGNHLMRVMGDEIHTSGYARFPVADAKRAWPVLEHQRRKLSDDVQRIDINASVGNFRLDHMTAQGVRAGCHFVAWSEVEYIANELGL